MDKHSKHVVNAIRIIALELDRGQALEIRPDMVLPIVEDDMYDIEAITLNQENDEVHKALLEQLGG